MSRPRRRIVPLGRQLEPADHPQRRGLAAARRAEQREELAGADLERDAVDRPDLAESLLQVEQLDLGGRRDRLGRHRDAEASRGRVSVLASVPGDATYRPVRARTKVPAVPTNRPEGTLARLPYGRVTHSREKTWTSDTDNDSRARRPSQSRLSLLALLPLLVVPVLAVTCPRQREPDEPVGVARIGDHGDDLHVLRHLPGQCRRDAGLDPDLLQ